MWQRQFSKNVNEEKKWRRRINHPISRGICRAFEIWRKTFFLLYFFSSEEICRLMWSLRRFDLPNRYYTFSIMRRIHIQYIDVRFECFVYHAWIIYVFIRIRGLYNFWEEKNGRESVWKLEMKVARPTNGKRNMLYDNNIISIFLEWKNRKKKIC